MRTRLYSPFFAAALACGAQAAPPASDCGVRRDYLAAGLAGASDVDSLLRKAAAPDARLVVFAENHRRRPIDLYTGALETIKSADPALDCLFLEMYGLDQALIDAYLSGRATFEQTTAAARDREAKGRNTSFRGDEGPLFDAAKRLGLSVIAADVIVHTPAEMDKDPSLVAKSVKKRNPHMAERIVEAFRGGLCRKGAMILGQAHAMPLITDRSESRWPSVPESVRARGLKVFAINVVHREGRDPKYGDSLAPNDCSWNLWERLPPGSPPRAFAPRSPSPAIEPVYDAGDPGLSWDDAPRWESYDGVIVKP